MSTQKSDFFDKLFVTTLKLTPGIAQGITRVMISYPFDYIRLHTQINGVYTGTFNPFKLYKGVRYSLGITPLDRGIQFFGYEKLRENGYNELSSSTIMPLVATLYNVPVQYIVGNNIINGSKVKFSYKGFISETSKSIPMSILYMYVYDKMRQKYGKEGYQAAINGSISSLSGWTIMYPLNTIRALKQTQNLNFRDYFKTKSLLSYYKGIGLVYVRSIPSAGAGMWVYETVRNLIDNKNYIL